MAEHRALPCDSPDEKESLLYTGSFRAAWKINNNTKKS
jgi:hypothetical protein